MRALWRTIRDWLRAGQPPPAGPRIAAGGAAVRDLDAHRRQACQARHPAARPGGEHTP